MKTLERRAGSGRVEERLVREMLGCREGKELSKERGQEGAELGEDAKGVQLSPLHTGLRF